MAEHTSTLPEPKVQRTTIYSLIDPKTALIRYIGKAADIELRYKRHLVDANNRNMRSSRWIRKLLRRGLKPIMQVIEECEGDGGAEEIFHIRLARQDGLHLCNATIGGEGMAGMKHSAAARAKMSAIRKGVPKPEWWKAKVAATLKGRLTVPIEVRRAQGLRRRGCKLPKWQIELLRKASLGRKKTPEESRKHAEYLRSLPKEEWGRRAKKRERFFVHPWTEEDGKRLLGRRIVLGVSSYLVAEMSGLNPGTLRRIERALSRPRKRNLAKIELALEQLKAEGYTPERARKERAAIRTRARWPESPMGGSWGVTFEPPPGNGYK